MNRNNTSNIFHLPSYINSTITLDPDLRIRGQERAYLSIVQGAVGGAAGVIH